VRGLSTFLLSLSHVVPIVQQKDLSLANASSEIPTRVYDDKETTVEEKVEERSEEEILHKYTYSIPMADVIIGSELTYNTLSITSVPQVCASHDGFDSSFVLTHFFMKVIRRYLKSDGAFVEILSDDRDGVPAFLKEMENCGFTMSCFPVQSEFLGNYGTGQRPETYHIYIFHWK
jgi:hypothetical protein